MLHQRKWSDLAHFRAARAIVWGLSTNFFESRGGGTPLAAHRRRRTPTLHIHSLSAFAFRCRLRTRMGSSRRGFAAAQRMRQTTRRSRTSGRSRARGEAIATARRRDGGRRPRGLLRVLGPPAIRAYVAAHRARGASSQRLGLRAQVELSPALMWAKRLLLKAAFLPAWYAACVEPRRFLVVAGAEAGRHIAWATPRRGGTTHSTSSTCAATPSRGRHRPGRRRRRAATAAGASTICRPDDCRRRWRCHRLPPRLKNTPTRLHYPRTQRTALRR